MRMLSGTAIALVALLGAGPALAQAPTPAQQAGVMRDVNLTETQARVELAHLTPALRAEVLQRATGGNTIRGVMETMMLNNVSQLFAARRVVAVDFLKGVVVVEGDGNQVRSYAFDVATLQIRP